MENIDALMEKYDHFKDAVFRTIQKPSDRSVMVTLAIQNDDGEDTHEVKIMFMDVIEARLLENSVLPFLDMMRGVTFIHERDRYAFALGHSGDMLHVKNAPLYIISTEMTLEDIAL